MMIRSVFILLFLIVGCQTSPLKEQAKKVRQPSSSSIMKGPVTLVYHRFGPPNSSTSTHSELFKKQMGYLAAQGFDFLDAESAIEDLKNSKKEGEHSFYSNRAVIITFDDPHKSIFTVGAALFREYDIPVMLFINTDDVGKKKSMSWEQINQLLNDPSLRVKIGCHSYKHANMPSTMTPLEMKNDLQICMETIKEKTGKSPKLFAYPYGEYSEELINVVKDLGFKAAFAQYSGVVYEGSNFFALPRFPMNDFYGKIKEGGTDFRLKVNTLPLPIEIVNQENMMRGSKIPARIEFTLDPGLRASDLRCFSNVEIVETREELSKHNKAMWRDKSRFILQWNKPFSSRREYINCTLLGIRGKPIRYYWHSFKLGDPNLPER